MLNLYLSMFVKLRKIWRLLYKTATDKEEYSVEEPYQKKDLQGDRYRSYIPLWSIHAKENEIAGHWVWHHETEGPMTQGMPLLA